jgi:hypothetical protein
MCLSWQPTIYWQSRAPDLIIATRHKVEAGGILPLPWQRSELAFAREASPVANAAKRRTASHLQA